jgi:citrate lyase subunit beta / citryl-CoA lyase
MIRFLNRSMLFVPSASESRLARAAQSEADAIILDWEDGTALRDKPAARRATLEYLASPPAVKAVWVRVNPAGTALFQEDLDALQTARPVGIVLPKCDSVSSIVQMLALFEGLLMPLIESAAGLLAAAEIARCSPRVAALGFGAEDFSADTGLLPGPDGIELLFARSAIIVAARATGAEPIDSPSLDYKNAAAVEASARQARRLGFSGKMAIHPAQLAIINEAFTPSTLEIERARALLAAFDAQPGGASGFDGKMVDEAVIRRARLLLRRVDV